MTHQDEGLHVLTQLIHSLPKDEIEPVLRELCAIIRVQTAAQAFLLARSQGDYEEAIGAMHWLLADAESDLLAVLGRKAH